MPPAPKVKLRKVELVKTHSSDKEQTKARRWCSKETVLFKGGVKVEGKPFESHRETKAGEFTEHTPIFDIYIYVHYAEHKHRIYVMCVT